MEELLRAMRTKGISVEDLRRFEAQSLAEGIRENARVGIPDNLAQDLLDGVHCYLLFPDEEFLEQMLGRHGSQWLREQALDRIVATKRGRLHVVKRAPGCAPV